MLHTFIPQALAYLNLAPDVVSVAEVDERSAYLCLHRWLGTATLARERSLSREMARGLAAFEPEAYWRTKNDMRGATLEWMRTASADDPLLGALAG